MTPRSDYLSALGWAAFGLVVLIASWRLDRLGKLGINPWSAPGLTPGLVGVLMILLAIALGMQARKRSRAQAAARTRADGVSHRADEHAARPPDREHAARLPGSEHDINAGSDGTGIARSLLAAVLCLAFAGVSLGRGVPFMAEAAVFVFLFATVFAWPRWRAEGRIVRSLLTTLVIALAAAAAISWLFESVFLVRLP